MISKESHFNLNPKAVQLRHDSEDFAVNHSITSKIKLYQN